MDDNHSDLAGKEFIFEYGTDRILPPSDKTGGAFAIEQRAYRRERIVRCRDCAWGRQHQWEGVIYCGMFNDPTEDSEAMVEPDGFCAWGEPKSK